MVSDAAEDVSVAGITRLASASGTEILLPEQIQIGPR